METTGAGAGRAERCADLPRLRRAVWWRLTEGQLTENTKADYRWRLEKHLLGYFGGMPLDQIKAATVETYIAGKLAGTVYEGGEPVREGDPLSARSINMTVILLGAILERAVKHELI